MRPPNTRRAIRLSQDASRRGQRAGLRGDRRAWRLVPRKSLARKPIRECQKSLRRPSDLFQRAKEFVGRPSTTASFTQRRPHWINRLRLAMLESVARRRAREANTRAVALLLATVPIGTPPEFELLRHARHGGRSTGEAFCLPDVRPGSRRRAGELESTL